MNAPEATPAQPAGAAVSVPLARSLSMVYSEKEDRLLLTLGAKDVRLRLLVTRRLAGGLINTLANLLAKTSPGAQQVSQDVRESMVLFEHHDAVQAAARQKAAAGAKARADAAEQPKLLAPVLLAAVDINQKGERFTLIFKGPQQALAAFQASRLELHQVLDLLRSKTVSAGWALSTDARWLDAGAAKLRMN